jgi:hypothetical protein
VSSPLNLAPPNRPLPKFKKNLPKFSGNNIVSTNKHLVAFLNACHNIVANDNDTCMLLFVNSLEGKVVAEFFELPPKILSTWKELIYWFRSTYGKSKSPTEKLRECYSKISLTIAILHRGSFSISLCRLINPFLINLEPKIYIFPHILSLTSLQYVYILVAPLQLAYIGICARKYKMKLSFDVTTKDL